MSKIIDEIMDETTKWDSIKLNYETRQFIFKTNFDAVDSANVF